MLNIYTDIEVEEGCDVDGHGHGCDNDERCLQDGELKQSLAGRDGMGGTEAAKKVEGGGEQPGTAQSEVVCQHSLQAGHGVKHVLQQTTNHLTT
jgi:hypothetical protein